MDSNASSPSRRRFLGLVGTAGAAALATGSTLLPARARAAETPDAGPERGLPLAYPFTVGETRGWVLSDGLLRLGPVHGRVVTNGEPEAIASMMQERFLSPDHIDAALNTVLLETGGRYVLLDTGYGPGRRDEVGKQAQALASIGLSEADIDTVIITHAHPDHLDGYLDADGVPRFPDAELVFSAKEHRFWTSGNNRIEALDALFDTAQAASRAAGDRLRLVEPGDGIVPGLEAVEAYGHTPGHMAIGIHSGSESLLVTADAFNHPVLFLERPDYVFSFDFDGEAAVATRRKLLDRLAADRMRMLAYHFPFPGIGHIRRSGPGSYGYVAEPFGTG